MKYRLITFIIVTILIGGAFAGCADSDLDKNQTSVSNYQNISGQDLKLKLEQGDQLQIIDVREPYEFAEGHIEGSVNIPTSVFENEYSNINKDKDIYLICNSGNRSVGTAEYLLELGYTNVYNVTGGVSAYPGELIKE